MKFNIPKIIKPLDLGVYDEGMEGVELQVWVNPTRDMLNDSVDIQLELGKIISAIENPDKEEIAKDLIDGRFEATMDRQYRWYSKILSQKTDETTHLPPDDLKELADQDIALWQFIRTAVNGMIASHREGIKKG
jgi:hypothetical protein